MSSPIIPRGGYQQVALPGEVVRSNIETVLRQIPDMVSYDPTTDRGEMLSLKLAVDPGIPAQQKDGWSGTVVEWGITASEITDQQSGEVVTLPSLALMDDKGYVVRLYGWPAIKSWASIIGHMGKERCQLGVAVVVKRRPSGVPGRSYWVVIPDV